MSHISHPGSTEITTTILNKTQTPALDQSANTRQVINLHVRDNCNDTYVILQHQQLSIQQMQLYTAKI